MATVTISSNTFNVYADTDDADDYYNGSSEYATWNAYTLDEKARGLISATRLLNRQTWQGTLTSISPDTGLAWPRTSVTDKYGEDVDSATIPQDIVDACILLALDILSGDSVESSRTTEDLNKRIKAGSVEIEKFRAEKSLTTRFPVDVQELIGQYLSGSNVIANSLSYGTDGDALDDTFDFSGGF